MIATDELRRMLDERGVEHYDRLDVTEWVGADYEICHTNEVYSNGASVLVLRKCTTPAQAIAATVGRGTCRLRPWEMERDTGFYDCMECDCGYVADVGDWAEWHFCPNCGAKVVGG